MIILGIDPALTQTGWGVISSHKNTLNFIACGTIKTDAKQSLDLRLHHIYKSISPIPLLVIHRKSDPIVPIKFGEEIYQTANQPKEFLELSGEGHVDAFTSNDKLFNQKKLMNFLQKCH